MLNRIFFFIVCFVHSAYLFGQQPANAIDSLQSLVADLNNRSSNFTNDTTKIRTLNLLASRLIAAGDLLAGDSIAKEALVIGEKRLATSEVSEAVALKKGMARSYRNRGNASFYQENYNGALEYYFKEEAIYESFLADPDQAEEFKLKISSDLAKILGNIGNVYSRQDNYPKALANYYRSLTLHEKLKDEKQAGITHGNIGIIFYRMKDFNKALEYYNKALSISQKQNNNSEIARTMANIGIVYSDQKNYSRSLEYLLGALKLADNIYEEANYLAQIGSAYGWAGEYTKAFETLHKALKLATELDDKGLVSNLNGNIGGLLLKQNKLKEAESYLLNAMVIAKEIGELYDQKEWAYNLSELYRKQNRTELAFKYYDQYEVVKDSIFSRENSMNTLRKELDYEYEKKEAKEKAEHEKQIILYRSERKMNQQLLFFLVIGIVLVLLLLFFVQRAYVAKTKYANILTAEAERKELLLEEVHHRISNNLQIISSLLSLQSNSVKDDRLTAYLRESQDRIQSLSALHELLYKSNSQLEIDLHDYIDKVLDFHREIAHGLLSGIKINSNVASVDFPVKLAVPIALIVNELVTNSIKYAFPHERKGHINVSVLPGKEKKEEWVLIVSDDGIGLPEEKNMRMNSLGLRLVNIMVKQMNAAISVKSEGGTEVKIVFALTKI